MCSSSYFLLSFLSIWRGKKIVRERSPKMHHHLLEIHSSCIWSSGHRVGELTLQKLYRILTVTAAIAGLYKCGHLNRLLCPQKPAWLQYLWIIFNGGQFSGQFNLFCRQWRTWTSRTWSSFKQSMLWTRPLRCRQYIRRRVYKDDLC